MPFVGLLLFGVGGWWAGATLGGGASAPSSFGSTNWVCDLGQAGDRVFLRFLLTLGAVIL